LRKTMSDGEIFPSAEWMQALIMKLNSDEKYAQVARNWEGDMRIVIEPDDKFNQTMSLYLDLWHGKCRDAYIEGQTSTKKPAFVLNAPYHNIIEVLSGNMGPMQALMTRKLGVHGSMSYMMRNVPTILDFVRCCQEITHSWM
jgi:putative sterol carrier protein